MGYALSTMDYSNWRNSAIPANPISSGGVKFSSSQELGELPTFGAITITIAPYAGLMGKVHQFFSPKNSGAFDWNVLSKDSSSLRSTRNSTDAILSVTAYSPEGETYGGHTQFEKMLSLPNVSRRCRSPTPCRTKLRIGVNAGLRTSGAPRKNAREENAIFVTPRRNFRF